MLRTKYANWKYEFRTLPIPAKHRQPPHQLSAPRLTSVMRTTHLTTPTSLPQQHRQVTHAPTTTADHHCGRSHPRCHQQPARTCRCWQETAPPSGVVRDEPPRAQRVTALLGTRTASHWHLKGIAPGACDSGFQILEGNSPLVRSWRRGAEKPWPQTTTGVSSTRSRKSLASPK